MGEETVDDDKSIIEVFYSGFEAILKLPQERISHIGDDQAFPQFPEQDLIDLCRLARSHFMSQPTVLRVAVPVVIVGDIHGNFHDLQRILHHFGPTASYLFLGDYVDRGEFSIECITLLLTLAVKFPDQVFMLRGNHEFADVCTQYGFRNDVLNEYSEHLFSAFMDAFAYLPLAAVVNKTIFCVHGGIGASFGTIQEVDSQSRPIWVDRDNLMVRTLLWADPVTQNVKYGQATRSDVPTYGMVAVREFLKDNGLKLIVRAHQCVNGVQLTTGFPVITVFSASNYRPNPPNDAGVVSINAAGHLEKITFPPLPRVPRELSTFFTLSVRGERDQRGHPIAKPQIRSMPSAVRLQSASIAVKVPHRSFCQNSVAGLLVLRRLVPSKPPSLQSQSFSVGLTLEPP
jgi:diadenosine tetraphosphatase ApaH/serine/threonine PP2A family protein phosphatase